MNTTARNAQLAAATQNDLRWTAIVARDSKADGTFWYSVKTTGVYCRPSCAARLARPENVRFHATPADAEHAGFRPCKRCKPDQCSLLEQHAAKVTAACRLIEESEQVPSLGVLAAQAGLSPFHFHRVFKAISGLTPKAYAIAQRSQRVRDELGRSDTVTAAIYDAGYHSNARFYEKSNEVLGMTPSRIAPAAPTPRSVLRSANARWVPSWSRRAIAASARSRWAMIPDALARDLQDRFRTPI